MNLLDNKYTKKLIAEAFLDISEGIKKGRFKNKVKIGLTTFGSEHGLKEMVKACEMAKFKYDDFDIVMIGPKVDESFNVIEVKDADEGHKKMEELLEKGEIQGCVTQHYNFPIGVSTVGMAVTPSEGKNMIVSTTTGTTSTNRVEAMIINTVCGITAAKSIGISNPKVGILNVEGAREVERSLRNLKENGYKFEFSESIRADGGAVMRGNDVLCGTPDVMVCDSLTGNILIKMLSSFSSGGSYEVSGCGYGPGVGEGFDKIISIISRASGAPLICEALRYCARCAENNLIEKAEEEFKAANNAGLKEIIIKLGSKNTKASEDDVKVPPKKIVTFAIPGIDILEIDNACRVLWKEDIYSESGMGCTGPVLLVNESDAEKAQQVLNKTGFK